MKKSFAFICSVLFILLQVNLSDAAQLKKIKETVTKSGSGVIETNLQASQKSPKISPPNSFAATATIADTDSLPDPCGYAVATAWNLFEIQATEFDENIGDPVCVEVCYEAIGETLSEGSGYQALSGNGFEPFIQNCDPFEAQFINPTWILHDPLGSPPAIIFTDGPRSTSSTFAVSDCTGRTFRAAIGDTIDVRVGSFSAVAKGPEGGRAQAQSQAQMGLDLITTSECEQSFDPIRISKADSILFPWVVRSDDVTTVISVVNTAQTWAESVGLPFHDNRIHIEYWHKLTTANDQEEKCIEYNFDVTSSKDDMVTWDMAGHFNGGLPMFGDMSNEVIGVPDMTLAVENPRRAFLIVDNYTDALTDAGTNVDGTMYGEATIIEHKTGAAWGYIAYNAIGGPNDFSDADHRDQQGEVIGDSETTQTTLLNPNDAITKLFVTPTFHEGNTGKEVNQRRGNINARLQLCRYPERYMNFGNPNDPYSGDCTGGGIWNNEEGGFSFTTKKEVVCTTADNIVDFFGGAGSAAYSQWVASGKAGWAYLITQSGNIDNRDGSEAYEEADEAIIGKLEFGTSLNWDGSIADTINTFVWLRDNATYLAYCTDIMLPDWRCDPGGINIIHNEFYKDFEQLPN
jgi:hypothetical protein